MNRSTQLRLRRVFRRRQKQIESVTQQAEAQFDDNLIARFDRLLHVKRFALGWLALVVLISTCTILQTLALSGYYQKVLPVPGGTYNEGIVGTYNNANPIYATGAVNTAVSKLLFSGLLTYTDQNHLTGDLASSYRVDQTGKHYTVILKPHLTWQDGKPLTAQDVAFTYHLIQNPDAGSSLIGSWQGIRVTAVDSRTITFDLPSTLSAFPYSLTNGILPAHLLADVPPTQMRANSFNTITPVGSGPFAWQALQVSGTANPETATSLIQLKPFKSYASGAPKLDSFVLHTYGTDQQLIRAFSERDINAMAGLDSLPSSLAHDQDIVTDNFSSTAAVMTFFKTSSGILSDVQIRQALVQATNVNAIIQKLGYATRPVREPLLLGQLGYDAKYQQASYNLAAANSLLDKDGWVRQANGIRSKAGKPLTFRLYAQDNSENQQTVRLLSSDWRKLGVNLSAILQPQADFQTTLEFHTYDALLYGIAVGVDPDVFAYWDSSQADIRSPSRLNFSEYKSTVADTALEAGRTRSNPDLRIVKYRPFLQAWQADAPALGLYQPRFLYVTRGTVYGLHDHTLNSDSDRYNSVANWEIHTARITN